MAVEGGAAGAAAAIEEVRRRVRIAACEYALKRLTYMKGAEVRRIMGA